MKRALTTSFASMAMVLAVVSAEAAPVTETFNYRSTLTSDANGPLDLIAELNYDDARVNAPIAVVMHGYSPATGNLGNVRANAQRIRDYGCFAISVAMRGRDGADGTRDSGGLEIYDIYDAVEAVKAQCPALVNPEIVYVTGYSGGGGNTMSALTKFPDTFNAGASFFGMSDYGYDLTNGWYFYGAGSRTSQLDADIGDPTPLAAPAVTDRYRARASNLASVNNPYSEIHLFVNEDETICPAVNSRTYYSNAVSREAFAGEFTNITVHIGATGLYEDFDNDSVNDANEQQYWPHGSLNADLQYAAERWFMDRLLVGQIPKPVLNKADSLFVAGFVKTARFECFAGDGQEGAVQLDYDLTGSSYTFRTTVLGLNTQMISRLTVGTEEFRGRMLEVLLNGVSRGTFGGGGEWTAESLAHGDTLELKDLGPATVWWADVDATNVRETAALAHATLMGAPADVWAYYGTNSAGQQQEGWVYTNTVGNNVETGLVTLALTNLLPGQTYAYVFYATNGTLEADAWSAVGTFTTEAVRRPPSLYAYYGFEYDFRDRSGNARHGSAGGGGVAFSTDTPSALAHSAGATDFDGNGYVTLPYLGLYNSLAASGAYGLTISLWIKSDSSTPQSWFISEGYTTHDNPAYVFGHSAGDASLRALVRTLGGGPLPLDKTTTTDLYDGSWHHWAWTDSNGTANVYIDGAPAAPGSGTWDYAHNAIPFDTTTIGAWIRNAAETRKYPVVGQVDDVSIWDSILSEAVIARLAAGVSPLDLISGGVMSNVVFGTVLPYAGRTAVYRAGFTPSTGEVTAVTFDLSAFGTGSGTGMTLSAASSVISNYTFSGFASNPTGVVVDDAAKTVTFSGGETAAHVPHTIDAVPGTAGWRIGHPAAPELRTVDVYTVSATGRVAVSVLGTLPDSDLVACYAFENDFTDATTNAYHGTNSGAGATFSSDTPAARTDSTAAGAFNGVDYVALPYLGLYDELGGPGAAGISVSLWIKGAPDAAISWFLAEGSTAAVEPAYVFGRVEDSIRPRAFVRTDAGGTPRMDQRTAPGGEPSAIFDGEWHHWVWTDSNGEAEMYIDGEAAPSEAGDGEWDYTRGTLTLDTTTIGALVRRPGDPKYPFVGRIDDVSVWRTILREGDIRALAAGLPPETVIGGFDRRPGGTLFMVR